MYACVTFCAEPQILIYGLAEFNQVILLGLNWIRNNKLATGSGSISLFIFEATVKIVRLGWVNKINFDWDNRFLTFLDPVYVSGKLYALYEKYCKLADFLTILSKNLTVWTLWLGIMVQAFDTFFEMINSAIVFRWIDHTRLCCSLRTGRIHWLGRIPSRTQIFAWIWRACVYGVGLEI